jgi:hypothetical protein
MTNHPTNPPVSPAEQIVNQMWGQAADARTRRDALRAKAEQEMAGARAMADRVMAEAAQRRDALLAEADAASGAADRWAASAMRTAEEHGLPPVAEAGRAAQPVAGGPPVPVGRQSVTETAADGLPEQDGARS